MVEGDQSVRGFLDVTGPTILRSDVSVSGALTLDAATILSSRASAYIFSTVSNVYIADALTGNSRVDIATGTTASGATKVVNIGTNGANNSTTNIVIGSLNSGTTTLQNYTVVDDSLKVNTDLTVGSSRFVVQGSTGNTTLVGTLAVNSW
jgi:hypothetical protein